jgi:SWIM/SEC-C metal-binding protein
MARLGTKKRPASASVQTEQRAKQILDLCNEHGWQVIVGIEPDKPEDISEVQRLLNPPKPIQADPKVGRNDPCPCGSGKKFKKCCMNKQQEI